MYYVEITTQFKLAQKLWTAANGRVIDAMSWDNQRKIMPLNDDELLIHHRYGDKIIINGKAAKVLVPARNNCAPIFSQVYQGELNDLCIVSRIGGFGGRYLRGVDIDEVFEGEWVGAERRFVRHALPSIRPLWVWRENYPYPYPQPVFGSKAEALAAFDREREAPKRIGGHPKGDSKSCPCPEAFQDFARIIARA